MNKAILATLALGAAVAFAAHHQHQPLPTLVLVDEFSAVGAPRR